MGENSKETKTKQKIHLPSFVFVAVMVLYYELLLHLWTTEALTVGRVLSVAAFGLGCGGVLGLLISLLPKQGLRKWSAVAVVTVLAVLYLVQYFLYDAYKTFMPLESVINGAGGVASGYFSTVMSLLWQNLWRIGLVLVPVVLYAVFARCAQPKWLLRGMAAGVTVLAYVLAFVSVNVLTHDAAQLNTACSWDTAIHAFGLNVALALDAAQELGMDRQNQFEVVQPMPATQTEPQETTPADTDPAETQPSQTQPAETEPIVYGENAFDIDFAALAEAESNSKISSLHSYVASLAPSSQNAYTGLFEGKNLIFLSAEAFCSAVIDPELTPTLYRMATEGIRFTDYYQPVWGGGTTTGEFTNLTGLCPGDGVGCMDDIREQDYWFTMGNQLQDLGYYSMAYHNNDYTYYSRHRTHTYLGYDAFIGYGNGMEEGVSQLWPESDLEMIQFTVEQYIHQQPFNIYYMTVSGHCHYSYGSNAMARKNWEAVEELPYSKAVKAYLACNLELEHAMTYLIQRLEEEGIADDTVIVLASDHYPYGLAPSDTWGTGVDYLSELYGYKANTNFTRDTNTLIIWSGCLEGQDLVVETPTFSLDIVPTLSNLFGVAYDSRLLVGRDVFSDQEALVFWLDYSWKTDKGSYNAYTGVFTPAQGVTVEEEYVQYISSVVRNKVLYCRHAQWYNYFNALEPVLAELE